MTEDQKPPEEPVIHVDSDWKQRAREERKLADDSGAAAEPGRAQGPPLPEPTLLNHVSQLAAETAMALGDVEHPSGGTREPDLPLAGYLIDTLEMLQAKTEGNRDEAETRLLEQALYGLRLRFVERTKADSGA